MILEIYKSWVIVLVLHECVHIFFVLLFGGKIGKVVIGNFFFIKIKKVAISPIVLHCFVTYEEGSSWSLFKKSLVLLMPAVVNIAMGVLVSYDLLFIKIFSLFIGINSLLPIPYLETDGYLMLKEVQKTLHVKK
ncbi:hypothetical protein [Listeria booriae]|uniref:hypothetical protein n=1 Tax=Listeria booriae TaxID=1552123 RepID=UPI0016272ADB|nr:hypothetical protein [Listeria booriae]MBC1975658.1 hypothetical protein [Listeria booriae]MBC1985138.1 hypothetical protein [Listeria booriae]MBC2033381.1 hypothetical protein [Listeria booriae]